MRMCVRVCVRLWECADFACALVYVHLQVRVCLCLCAPCVCAICAPTTLTLSPLPFNLHSSAQVIRQKARLASVHGRCRQHLPHVARYLSPLSCPNLPSSTPLLMDVLAKPPSPTDAAAGKQNCRQSFSPPLPPRFETADFGSWWDLQIICSRQKSSQASAAGEAYKLCQVHWKEMSVPLKCIVTGGSSGIGVVFFRGVITHTDVYHTYTVYTCGHKRWQRQRHGHRHTQTHARTHTRTHARTHKHTHTRTHTWHHPRNVCVSVAAVLFACVCVSLWVCSLNKYLTLVWPELDELPSMQVCVDVLWIWCVGQCVQRTEFSVSSIVLQACW